MAAQLDGKKVAILATDGVEQVELIEPRKALEEAGAHDASSSRLEAGEIQGFDHLDTADTFPVDKAVADVSADDYDALMLPGGVANPDFLRADEDAVAFVARRSPRRGKPIASICHGPWIARRGRRRQGPHADVVAVAADRHPQRRRRPGSTRRSTSTTAS